MSSIFIILVIVAFAVFVYYLFFQPPPAELIGPIQIKSTNTGRQLAPLGLSLFKQSNGSLVISTSAIQSSKTMYPQNQLWVNWWNADGKPYLPHGKTLAEINLVLDPLTTNSNLSQAGFTKDALLAILQWVNIPLAIECPCPSTFGFSTAKDIIVTVPANIVG